jgi:MFS family permease
VSWRERVPFHYGWVVVFAGMVAILASLGFGRFALGMLLPSMGDSLGLSYSQMGLISTGNFIGYTISVLVSGFLAVRLGPSRLIVIALIGVGITMLLVSRANGFMMVLVLYFFTGIGSGAANIPVMGLVSTWFSRAVRGKAAGFLVIGSGFAIIIAGWFVPVINARYMDVGWRVNWSLLGIFVLVAAAIAFVLLRDRPEDVGLTALGSEASPPREMDMSVSLYRMPVIWHLGAIYFLFGFTYVIYATFAVTTMVKDWGMSEASAGGFWMWVGGISLLSGPVFGTLSDKFGRKAGFSLVFALQGVSYLLIASQGSTILLYLSVACFGVGAWAIPGIMAAAVGDHVGSKRAPAAFGIVTFVFALGQISGPALAGMIAERVGNFAPSFIMAAVAAGIAIALCQMLKKAS